MGRKLMTTEYTPSTIGMRVAWQYWRSHGSEEHNPKSAAEFDRWLARVKAQVWNEAVEAQLKTQSGVRGITIALAPNPYRDEQRARLSENADTDPVAQKKDIQSDGERMSMWIDENGLHLRRLDTTHSDHCDDFACVGCECDPECDDRADTE